MSRFRTSCRASASTPAPPTTIRCGRCSCSAGRDRAMSVSAISSRGRISDRRRPPEHKDTVADSSPAFQTGLNREQGRNDMITLYHCHAARSSRPLWMLEEMGLPYDLKMLPSPPRVFAKEYLALNPLGTIPLMIDGETRMTESSGICHYLGTRYGPTPLIIGEVEPAYGAFLNWMYFSDATLTFPQTLVLRYSHIEPEERRNPQVATDYAKWFLGRLRAVEAATANAETLVAGRFTAADIVIGYALRLAENIGLAKDFGPNVNAYWQRLQTREGFKRAVAAENQAGEEQKVAPRVR